MVNPPPGRSRARREAEHSRGGRQHSFPETFHEIRCAKRATRDRGAEPARRVDDRGRVRLQPDRGWHGRLEHLVGHGWGDEQHELHGALGRRRNRRLHERHRRRWHGRLGHLVGHRRCELHGLLGSRRRRREWRRRGERRRRSELCRGWRRRAGLGQGLPWRYLRSQHRDGCGRKHRSQGRRQRAQRHRFRRGVELELV